METCVPDASRARCPPFGAYQAGLAQQRHDIHGKLQPPHHPVTLRHVIRASGVRHPHPPAPGDCPGLVPTAQSPPSLWDHQIVPRPPKPWLCPGPGGQPLVLLGLSDQPSGFLGLRVSRTGTLRAKSRKVLGKLVKAGSAQARRGGCPWVATWAGSKPCHSWPRAGLQVRVRDPGQPRGQPRQRWRTIP